MPQTLIGGIAFTTIGLTVGSVVSIMSASAMAVSAAQISVGSDTPVHGVTIGLMIGGLFLGVGMLWQGGKYVFRMGAMFDKWQQAMMGASQLAEVVERIEEGRKQNTVTLERVVADLDALERWRAEVDPILAAWRRRLGTKEA